MEFEKSLFRVHDRLLRGKSSLTCIKRLQLWFLILTIFSLVNLCIMHSNFVDTRSILKTEMEQQLKPIINREQDRSSYLELNGNLTGFEYQSTETYMKMPPVKFNYSNTTGEFQYDQSER